MFPSILRFDFNSILGSFLLLGDLMGYFRGWGRVRILFSFCMFSSILIFDFYLILGSFFTCLGPNGLFSGLG